MFWRRLLLGGLFLCSAAAGAVEFSYGDFFTVSGIEKEAGRLQMPLERKKYTNVRLLSRPVYEFLVSCETRCRWTQEKTALEVSQFRAALSRPGMWIADVDFNAELEITFLIFKNADGYAIKPPQSVLFKDQALWRRIQKELTARVERTQL